MALDWFVIKSTACANAPAAGERSHHEFTAMFSKVYKPELSLEGKKPARFNLHLCAQKRKTLPNQGYRQVSFRIRQIRRLYPTPFPAMEWKISSNPLTCFACRSNP